MKIFYEACHRLSSNSNFLSKITLINNLSQTKTWNIPHKIPETSKIKHLDEIKRRKTHEMMQKYPSLYHQQFMGKIAYTLRTESIDDVITNGGFTTNDNLWFSNTGSGENRGAICLSFLPEITTLFMTGKKSTMYAIPLFGNFICPGGKWRQVISPGALPLPNWWMARDVIEKTHDNRFIFGPIRVCGVKTYFSSGEKLNDYLGEYLTQPKEIGLDDDYPNDYEIKDTQWTKIFQEKMTLHYKHQLIYHTHGFHQK